MIGEGIMSNHAARYALVPFVAATLVGAVAFAADPAPTPSEADKTKAKKIFEAASKLYEKGATDAVCAQFAESERLYPRFSASFNLGECLDKLGKYASAHRAFDRASDEATAAGQTDHAATATERGAQDFARHQFLTVALPKVRRGLVARLDGVPSKDLATGFPLGVDSGPHVIDFEAVDGCVASVSILSAVASGIVKLHIPAVGRRVSVASVPSTSSDASDAVPAVSATPSTTSAVVAGVGSSAPVGSTSTATTTSASSPSSVPVPTSAPAPVGEECAMPSDALPAVATTKAPASSTPDRAAALAALKGVSISDCGAGGPGKIIVGFAKSGAVNEAMIASGTFDAPTTACILGRFRAAKMPPFSEGDAVYTYAFTLPTAAASAVGGWYCARYSEIRSNCYHSAEACKKVAGTTPCTPQASAMCAVQGKGDADAVARAEARGACTATMQSCKMIAADTIGSTCIVHE